MQSTEGISREIPHERFDRVMTVGRTFRAEKVAGQRNESCAGLLFPPEQGVNLYALRSDLKWNFSEIDLLQTTRRRRQEGH